MQTHKQAAADLNFAGRIFMETAAGVAVASLGQIVDGYAVVFGREGVINLRLLELDERLEFLRLVRAARRCVEQRFGPTVVFEHGASCSGTNVSCGVNRIHLHIVPFRGSALKDELGRTFQCKATASTIEQILGSLSSWSEDCPYFWVEDAKEVSLFSYGEKRESQVVRRAIARLVGLDDRWNWREYPTQEAAERVAQFLSSGLVLQPTNQLQAAVA